MNGIVLLTRPSNWQGVLTLLECSRRGVPVAGVIVEPKTSADRVQRLRKFLAANGLLDTARKVWLTALSERRFSAEIGRAGLETLPRTVTEMAAQLGVTVYQVASHNDSECEATLRRLDPDVILLAGTRIIKPHIIGRARIGCLNAHTGWLPQYRGVHANLWALLEGGPRGVTVHYVDPGVDTGAILLQEELPVLAGDTLERLEVRTMQLCARLMLDAVQGVTNGSLAGRPQYSHEGRQYRAMAFRNEREVRRLLRRLPAAPSGVNP